ncbi:fatty acid desaturase [Geodermatophilus bullaregiensis]|uniref:fatty acid desaturase family protein n=1 Tax=Geodermatophilus bullaregiensis TaxID=1564160 RepID=UPI00195BA6E2|nr:acyl-CoA desaturase [Geodermatophilus bullaregiensis]MBM7808008.1 fatty acid desaturase [Geodermatophilus bullaregiensis]
MASPLLDPAPRVADRPTVRRPRTDRQTSTYGELSRQVQAAGLLQRRRAWYWTQMLVMTGAFAGVWVAFALLGDSWLQLGVAAVLAVVVTQFGFLAHDAAHRQVFGSARWNDWAARVMAGAFAGLSAGWWSHKHSRHHSAPNQEGRDPDIGLGVLAFTPAAAAPRTGLAAWLTARQGWAFFPLLLLEGLNLHVASLQVLVTRRDLAHRRVELVLVVGRLAGYLAAVLLVLSPGKAAAFLAVQLGVFGLLLGGAFAPNHKGMPIVPEGARVDFLRRQVLMSRNIDGGLLTDAAMGGLNYQIEHHLFPSMPRPNLRRAQPIVRAFCRANGVTYTQTSLVGSYGIVVRYLNAVGLGARDPFSCPLVQTLRN